MTTPLYAVKLPNGARMLSPYFCTLFFVACGFAWKPGALNSEITIMEVEQ
jgi:hypothetical protein